MYIISQKLVSKSLEDGYLVEVQRVGSSFICMPTELLSGPAASLYL